jgi:hypothetical protein
MQLLSGTKDLEPGKKLLGATGILPVIQSTGETPVASVRFDIVCGRK